MRAVLENISDLGNKAPEPTGKCAAGFARTEHTTSPPHILIPFPSLANCSHAVHPQKEVITPSGTGGKCFLILHSNQS